MDLLPQVKLVCQRYNITPARQKGQNFLINDEVIRKIISASVLNSQDTVLEVGPGLGILTEALIKQANRVISVELDKKLFNFLKVKFAHVKNLTLINDDILNYKGPGINNQRYKIVANLPYNITSHFLRKFLTADFRPESMTLLIQKEVAGRLCAQPGQMSLLAISVQLFGEPKIISEVTRQNFWPQPEVDSAIIKIDKIKNQNEVDKFLRGTTEKKFWRLVRIGFSARRKQLQHNLAAGLKIPASEVKKLLNQANFDPMIRAQNLSINDWLVLAKAFDSWLG